MEVNQPVASPPFDAPNLMCMWVVPFWMGEHCVPLIMGFCAPSFPLLLMHPREGMFLNCSVKPMRKPTTPFLCAMLCRKFYNVKSTHQQLSQIFWNRLQRV